MTIIEAGQNALPSFTHSVSIYSQEMKDISMSVPSPDAIATGHYQSSPFRNMNCGRSFHYNDNREFICGWAAAFINVTVTFPMNKLMFRQIVHGISTAGAMQQLKMEGIKHLYRGILPPLCQKTVSTSIMFGMYGKYKWRLKKHCPFLNKNGRMVIAASLAGCTEAILCPLERIQSILQDKNSHGAYKNTLHCYRELRRFGLPEYYRGVCSILLRNSVSNVLFFGLRKRLKNTVTSVNDSWYRTAAIDFISGASLGAIISTLVYPLNVVKTHQQTQIGGPFQSIRQTFIDIYKSRGNKMRSIFKGVHVNYTRALASWGIINASYESLLMLFSNKDALIDT